MPVNLSSIPISVLRLEDTGGCGGSLLGGLKIDQLKLHFIAVRVATEQQRIHMDGDDTELRTVAFHETDAGRDDLDENYPDGVPCACGVVVDKARQLESTKVFTTTVIPGFPGDWIITAHPYQQS